MISRGFPGYRVMDKIQEALFTPTVVACGSPLGNGGFYLHPVNLNKDFLKICDTLGCLKFKKMMNTTRFKIVTGFDFKETPGTRAKLGF